jgi:hypothetical protein
MPRDRKANGGQGMNWIRPEKRLAIYLRDGLACCWCGATCEQDTLTLDHCKPHSMGGSNDVVNLLTCCRRCNSSRGTRSLPTFAKVVAEYLDHGITADAILRHLRNCRLRRVSLSLARALIIRRGSFFSAVHDGEDG